MIVQDVRGRYTSDGEFYTFRHEIADGYDAVEWAAALPYSNGKVGMTGGSYVGATQMLAAIAKPPHLAGIMPTVTSSNYHANWTYHGGALEQWFDQNWTTQLATNTMWREIEKDTNALVGTATLPLTRLPCLQLQRAPRRRRDHQSHRPVLSRLARASFLRRLLEAVVDRRALSPTSRSPLSTSAAGTTSSSTARSAITWASKPTAATTPRATARSSSSRSAATPASARKIGDVEFGDHAIEFPPGQVLIDWYDFLFKGIQNEFATDKPVHVFVMGENKYQQFSDWPPPEMKATRYYIHSNGSANSLRGDGSLSTTAPKKESADKFTFDPANPVPTIGGSLCCDMIHYEPGPRDQRSAEGRNDVLVYSTKPLDADMQVTGPVTFEAWVKSSAVDTDFTAMLVDVAPDGFAKNLADGILRMRYRDSDEKPDLINPDQVYKITVDLWATANTFQKGHTIRLQVSSSNFPRFDRNHNTGADQATSKDFVTATNTILHDADHPSALILPVIPTSTK